jgi:small subunit ribosomal protein S12
LLRVFFPRACVNPVLQLFLVKGFFILATALNRLRQKPRPTRRPRAAALLKAPQAGGNVFRPRIVTPKKPNSARRPVVKVFLHNDKHVVAHIPGIGHNLRRHSKVLVRGGGARDLPGVRHSCIRGVYDFLGVKNKNTRRSIYGVKRPGELVTKLRRKFRQTS